MLPLIAAAIPAELRDIPAWVGWRSVQREGRWTKEPVNIRTGGLAASDNPATWVDFQAAVANYKRLNCDGVGLCRTGDLTFIDMDGCVDANGKLLPFEWATKIWQAVSGRAYTEMSPSGRGIRAVCRGTLPPGRRQFNEPNLEHTGFGFYDDNRYCTFTGQVLPQCGPICDLSVELAQLHAELFPQPRLNGSTNGNGHHATWPSSLSDAELIDHARRAANGPKFSRLWGGDTTDYPSPSEADLALCCHLAYSTGRDSARMDSLFRQSSLYRDKWERQDYRERTINKAIELVTGVYDPDRERLSHPENWPTPEWIEDTRPALRDLEAAGEQAHSSGVEAGEKASPEIGTCSADPTQMVGDVERSLRRFVVLPDAAYLPLAIWAIGTHAAQHFECFPYVALLSPTKQCGKTRLLEVLETLVYLPWRGTAPTSAALYRMITKAPTLLLDEVEAFNSKNKSESTQAILAILNAGHRKGATVPRCDGPTHEVKEFPVYGPKAFAAIGRLPDTLTDRSIVVTMQRRTKGQKVERFLAARAKAEAKPIRDGVASFATAYQGAIGQAYRRLLDTDLEFLSDRNAEMWFPLFAICSVSAPDRVAELKRCAVTLCADKAVDDADDSLPLKLLADIKTVWPEGQDRCDTESLIEKLKAREESPWVEYQLSPRKLAKMLRPFCVEPRVVRIGARVLRGYEYSGLEAAFSRYLEVESATSATSQ
jgi:hypothetical protein